MKSPYQTLFAQTDGSVAAPTAGLHFTGDLVRQLREYGIAPPHTTQPSESVVRFQKPRRAAAIACPRCGSANTTETSHFGSTACKSLYKCLDCLEPFDYFKAY